MSLTTINTASIKKNLKKLSQDFQTAHPYKHVVIENFFRENIAEKMLSEFPSMEQMYLSSAFSGLAEKKSQLSDAKKMPKIFQNALGELMSPPFRKIISEITGIKPILPDPDFVGGGLHQGSDGSFLDIHADFNKHMTTGRYRRFNILIYLNKNWKKSYGGDLEMWGKDMKKCVKKVAPTFNRCLIFATDKTSYHGYAKMHLPKGITRKSIAAYYYCTKPAEGEDIEFHNTLFQARPGEMKNKFVYTLLNSALIQKAREKMKISYLYYKIKNK